MNRTLYKEACVASYEQELYELREIYGHNNVKAFYYSEHRGTWILQFDVGEDEEFETKEEMLERLAREALSE